MVLINIFEILGTIAFAISGALLGVEKKLDIFGVCFLGIVTAVGGGIFRDILIGTIPPATFQNPQCCLISLITSIITFKLYKKMHKVKNIVSISDAIGLAVFTAIGANAAISHGMNRLFIVISTGMFTGIGGGIVRDVSVQHIPSVFKKEIYAVASIIGSLAFYICCKYLSREASLYICFTITLVIRMVSIRYNLNLPVYEHKENNLIIQ